MNNDKKRLIKVFENTSFLEEIKKCLNGCKNPVLEIIEATKNSKYLLMFGEKDGELNDTKSLSSLIFRESNGHFFIEEIGKIYKPKGFKIKDKIDNILKNPNIENFHKINTQNKKFWE